MSAFLGYSVDNKENDNNLSSTTEFEVALCHLAAALGQPSQLKGVRPLLAAAILLINR